MEWVMWPQVLDDIKIKVFAWPQHIINGGIVEKVLWDPRGVWRGSILHKNGMVIQGMIVHMWLDVGL